MKMIFIGANHEVTGSCTYVEACGKKFLVDFGMEQGTDLYENAKIPCPPSMVDFVLLTHAHIDHSGLLPLLYAGGFAGDIHATKATCNLCSIMLRDSAHIQEFEAEWRSRKGRRKGQDEVEPLYTLADAEGAISKLIPHPYEEMVELCEGIKIRFMDAGHLLGSSSIELWLTEDGETRKIVFSGDIGNLDQPLIRDPQYISEADYAVMESTYGTRRHEKVTNYVEHLAELVQKTFDRGGNVVIPSFAVGRTQELLYFIRQIKEQGLVKNHADFPVYVDSPLAIEATRVFMENKESCFDAEALEYVEKGVNPITFPGLNIAVTSDESRAINFDKTPKIIISASGMCEAGRIKHHLKHNLWHSECLVLFVGYQANNTLGRSLVEGAKTVKLFGEDINVAAQISVLPGISGHADVDGLDRWIDSFAVRPKTVFVNHGEDAVMEEFKHHLEDKGYHAEAPFSGAEFDLLTGVFTQAEPIKVVRKTLPNTSYQRLCASLDRLSALVASSKGLTNKDLAKLTDSINNLCAKWED
ncbi:MBL fold metallo-hydrolase RNA specificity domain-containing protein [uncultured Ruminococcus sp.]|uniref:MBL fold metallo-hydrolase RNA specificity domain-containing protein n=1 Tax=uncultured Ruminococcus sp. TaxID=165186 RepID=UPI0025E8EEEE|nr:MBL fold metallo-hydrolase [uncultured Ruminococcus sp.]